MGASTTQRAFIREGRLIKFQERREGVYYMRRLLGHLRKQADLREERVLLFAITYLISADYEQSLFFLSPSSETRETRK